VTFLLGEIVSSGRRIVGFDLTEIVPKLQAGIDAIVGARMLAKLCAVSIKGLENR
jgi:agmatinase